MELGHAFVTEVIADVCEDEATQGISAEEVLLVRGLEHEVAINIAHFGIEGTGPASLHRRLPPQNIFDSEAGCQVIGAVPLSF